MDIGQLKPLSLRQELMFLLFQEYRRYFVLLTNAYLIAMQLNSSIVMYNMKLVFLAVDFWTVAFSTARRGLGAVSHYTIPSSVIIQCCRHSCIK